MSNKPRMIEVKPTRAKEYSIELKAQVSRRGKMVYAMELSIPAGTLKEAVKRRQRFADMMVDEMRKSARRKPTSRSGRAEHE